MTRTPLLVPLLIVVLTAGCSRTPEGSPATAAGTASIPVAVAEAKPADLSQSLTLTAEFIPFEEVDVMAKVSGYVRKIYIDVGSRVSEGQTLAELDVPEMRADLVRSEADIQRRSAEVARAKDDVRRAQSGVDMTHVTYERLANVAKTRPGLIAQQEIDDARGKDLMADAQVAGSRSTLLAMQENVNVAMAEHDRLKAMYAYTKVTAPFAGVVTKRYADTGSMIQAGTASQTQAMPIAKLSRNNMLRLILPVPESAVPTIKIGSKVAVRVPSLSRNFDGRVARLSEKIQTGTRTMDVEVDVPNPQLILIPGMYAEVDLGLAERKGVLTVPLTARAEEGDHSVVYVVNAKNQIEIRRIQIGLETEDTMEIRSGLAEGDLVVIGNRSSLKQGLTVEPKKVNVGGK